MSSKKLLPKKIELTGLGIAPSQVWGGVRLVPLLKHEIKEDIRLAKISYRENMGVVSLNGELLDEGIKYLSYIPHGLVVSWDSRGKAAASFGAQLHQRDGKSFGKSVRVIHRMAKRVDKNQLRILPLHLAMEGFLALHFGGPDTAWKEYSRQVLSHGLDPRWEYSLSAQEINGLEDALRIFEIHTNQVGVLIFIADALASAFIVSHPDDYRTLHKTLLEDFYGQLFYYYGIYGTAPMMPAADDSKVESMAGLRNMLADMKQQWASFQFDMAHGIFSREVRSEKLCTAGPFQLVRFMTRLDPSEENHIGEAILRDNGCLEYLKTFRLSAAQTRRAYLLSHLAENGWNIEAAARALKQSKRELVIRLDKAGFGYILKDEVLQQAQKRKR